MHNTDIYNLRPTLAFSVGVTGHRDISEADLPQLSSSIRAVLERIRTAVKEVATTACLYGYAPSDGESVTLRILSEFARGADQLVVRAAEELGYQLFAVFPCELQSYANNDDFTNGEDGEDASSRKKARDALLRCATAPAIQLDGTMNSPDGKAGARPELEAHQHAGNVVLVNSDILVAIYDEDRRAGQSESARIVNAAIQQQIPVIALLPRSPYSVRVFIPWGKPPCGWQTLDLTSNNSSSVPGTNQTHVREIVEALLVPPDGRGTAHADTAQASHQSHDNPREAFFRETDPEKRYTAPVARIYKRLWSTFFKTLAVSKSAEQPKRPLPNPNGILKAVQSYYDQHYLRCDTLSNHYMAMYRSSFLLNYLLGGFAVTLALLAYAAKALSPLFLACEFFTVIALATNYLCAERLHWHHRATDYRFLAELFRHMPFLSAIGRVTPFPRSPSHHGQDARWTWMMWYFRAVVRERGPERLIVSATHVEQVADAMRKDLIYGQLDYYRRNSERYRRLHTTLEHATIICFGVTFVAVLLHLLPCWAVFQRGWFAGAAHFLHIHEAWLTLLAAALPAWGSAAHAVNSQAEAMRLAERYAMMALLLNHSYERLSRDGNAQTQTEVCQSSRNLAEFAENTASLMLSEVTDWREIYRMPQTAVA